MDKIIKKIEKWQEEELKKGRKGIKNNKYSYQEKKNESDGFKSYIHEYECPNGDVGFQIFLFNDNNQFRSFGYGAESLNRTWGWRNFEYG